MAEIGVDGTSELYEMDQSYDYNALIGDSNSSPPLQPISGLSLANVSFRNESNIFYHYDYEDALSTYYWDELIPPLVIYSIIFVSGIAGNFGIIFTVSRYRRMKTTTNVFLASLATADLLVILVCIPVKLARLFSYTWTMGSFTCKMVYYVQSMSVICSVLTMTAMSIERYYAIVYPMQAKYHCTISKSKKLCCAIWVLSTIFSSPTIVVQTHMEVGWVRPAFWCVRDFDSTIIWPLYETFLLVLILVLPAGIMAVAYTSIYVTVYKMAAARRRMTNSELRPNGSLFLNDNARKRDEQDTAEVRQLVTMLVVVVILFVVCWSPVLILNVVKSYSVSRKYSRTLRDLATAADLLSYCNSCVNPIIYGFMSRNFRQSFRQTLCCKRFRKRASLSNQISLSATRMSSVRRFESSNGFYIRRTPRRQSSSSTRIYSTIQEAQSYVIPETIPSGSTTPENDDLPSGRPFSAPCATTEALCATSEVPRATTEALCATSEVPRATTEA